jgi:hypothetical protein
LREGMKVVLTDEEDHELDGYLRFDVKHNMWVAIPDWSSQRKPSGGGPPISSPPP